MSYIIEKKYIILSPSAHPAHIVVCMISDLSNIFPLLVLTTRSEGDQSYPHMPQPAGIRDIFQMQTLGVYNENLFVLQ